MRLYHGSNQRVTETDLSLSRPSKDFGRAFYLSEDREQAEEMAKFKVFTLGGEVMVSEFELNESDLQTLNCKRFDTYSEDWARFVLKNREAQQQTHNYDVVFGPIANDRIGRQILNFQSGYIDFATFLKRIQYPVGITFQWAFCTEKAIQILRSIL
ncbi:MAG: DUF3990 domain-containing protein [Alloprevotella sp.]